MKVANIVPPSWIGIYPPGEYRLALAHWVLKYPDYAKRIKSSRAYVLLDNGAFEGMQLTASQLNEAAAAVGADEVVLPDVLGDSGETLRRSWEVLGKLAVKRVMFNPQGKTHQEVVDCLEAWLDKWNKSDWGSAYSLGLCLVSLRDSAGKVLPGTRLNYAPELVGTGLPVHMLGVNNIKMFASRELPVVYKLGIRGMDTSSAFALGAEGILLTPTAKKVFLKAPEGYKELTTFQRRLIFLNLAILDFWVGAGEGIEYIPTLMIRKLAQRWLRYWAEGFATLPDVMRACGMPSGRYALLKEDHRERGIRPLVYLEGLREDEVLVEV